MQDSGALDRLAAHYGIEPGFRDNWGEWRAIPAATRRALLAALGVAVAGEGELAASLREAEASAWREVLAPVAVLRRGGGGRFPDFAGRRGRAGSLETPARGGRGAGGRGGGGRARRGRGRDGRWRRLSAPAARAAGLRKMFRAQTTLDDYDREKT